MAHCISLTRNCSKPEGPVCEVKAMGSLLNRYVYFIKRQQFKIIFLKLSWCIEDNFWNKKIMIKRFIGHNVRSKLRFKYMLKDFVEVEQWKSKIYAIEYFKMFVEANIMKPHYILCLKHVCNMQCEDVTLLHIIVKFTILW